MSKDEERAVAKIMSLMAEAIELSWKRDQSASAKLMRAVTIGRALMNTPMTTQQATTMQGEVA